MLHIFSIFCSPFRSKSDQHPVINPQYTFSSPATVPASQVGQLWSLNSPIVNKGFELSLSLWCHCWHRTLKLWTKASLHLTSSLFLLPDVKTVGTAITLEVLHKVSAAAPWHSRIISIYHGDKTFVINYVQSSVLLGSDTVSMVTGFAIFWREKLSLHSGTEGSKGNPRPFQMTSVRKIVKNKPSSHSVTFV